MKSLNVIKFYLTREIYKELLSTYGWAKRVVYKTVNFLSNPLL